MNDLEDVAMDALERAESQSDDNQENVVEGNESVYDEQNDENGINTNDESENASDDELDGNNDDSEDVDNDEENEKDEEPEKNETKSDKKEEMSDEEFEELAKKRGYSKKQDEDVEKNNKNNFENTIKRPKEIDRDTWDAMAPINKVIYNNLPYIQAIGKDENVVRVKTAQQLPDDFEFVNKKAEMQFANDLQAQEMKAQKMSDVINQRISQDNQRQRSTQEAKQILSEIETLQKNGDLPTPKAKPGTKEFDTDEAVILINKVLGYRQERMKNGSMLSVEDAMMIYKAKHPDEFKNKTEAKGDAERKKIAKKISGNNKSADTSISAKKGTSPKYYKFGMSMEDVLDRALDEMDD